MSKQTEKEQRKTKQLWKGNECTQMNQGGVNEQIKEIIYFLTFYIKTVSIWHIISFGSLVCTKKIPKLIFLWNLPF